MTADLLAQAQRIEENENFCFRANDSSSKGQGGSLGSGDSQRTQDESKENHYNSTHCGVVVVLSWIPRRSRGKLGRILKRWEIREDVPKCQIFGVRIGVRIGVLSD